MLLATEVIVYILFIVSCVPVEAVTSRVTWARCLFLYYICVHARNTQSQMADPFKRGGKGCFPFFHFIISSPVLREKILITKPVIRSLHPLQFFDFWPRLYTVSPKRFCCNTVGLLDQRFCCDPVGLLDQRFCCNPVGLLDQRFCCNTVGLLDQRFCYNTVGLLDTRLGWTGRFRWQATWTLNPGSQHPD